MRRAFGDAVLEQRHETVLEARRRRLDFNALSIGQRSLVSRCGRPIQNDAHMGALNDGVEDAWRRRQSLLQPALVHVARRHAEAASPHPFGERGRSPIADQPSLMHQQHGAASFGLVQIGGAEEHGHALGLHDPVDNAPKLAARHRIDADRRLVEQQKSGNAHQGAGETEFLFHSARQFARQPIRERREAGHMQQFGIARRTIGRRNILKIGIKIEILLD